MPDALYAAKKADATSSNQLLTAHQPAMDLYFLRAICLFHECDALVAAQLARIASFVVALASKPSTHHAAVLRVAKCN